MNKLFIIKILFILVLSVCYISCTEKYDTHWVPIKSYKCWVTWSDRYYNFKCRTKNGDIFDVEMRHHHYYQSEHKQYLHTQAPCEIWVFKDTITNNCYYRLYKYDGYEAHTLHIVKIK
jgi:hypothetical protein